MATRMFTVETANKTLPLVSRIVQDIIEQYAILQTQRDQLRRLQNDRNTVNESLVQETEDAIDVLTDTITGYINELDAIGCQLKDFQTGLLDFPGEIEGRPILLCWKHDEKEIGYWHELDAGFSGRQPIETLFTGSRDSNG